MRACDRRLTPTVEGSHSVAPGFALGGPDPPGRSLGRCNE